MSGQTAAPRSIPPWPRWNSLRAARVVRWHTHYFLPHTYRRGGWCRRSTVSSPTITRILSLRRSDHSARAAKSRYAVIGLYRRQPATAPHQTHHLASHERPLDDVVSRLADVRRDMKAANVEQRGKILEHGRTPANHDSIHGRIQGWKADIGE